jgi:hypothetical protein
MNRECRTIFEMGKSVVHVSDAQPDSDAGGTQSAAKAKDIVASMEQADGEQRAGLIGVHAAALEKRRLRREMLIGPIAHMAEVGRRASREKHELKSTFRFKPSRGTYVGLQTAGRDMLAEAQTHKEVLMKYGLSEPVLTLFGAMLDQFDAAVALGVEGRTRHKGATKQLDALATELASLVRVMDARNRQRFQDDPKLLEAWISASTPRAKPSSVTPAEPPAPGVGAESRPAA